MTWFRWGILVVRFGCELAMLVALAYAGFAIFGGAAGWVLGVAAPVGAAVVWGLFVSPKATYPVPVLTRVAIEVALFLFASTALWLADAPGAALELAALAIPTSILHAVTEGEGIPG